MSATRVRGIVETCLARPIARETASWRSMMHGLGRAFPFLIDDIMRADDRRAADEWRRMHRLPDAPLPPPEPARTTIAARTRRVLAGWPLIGRRIAPEV